MVERSIDFQHRYGSCDHCTRAGDHGAAARDTAKKGIHYELVCLSVFVCGRDICKDNDLTEYAVS